MRINRRSLIRVIHNTVEQRTRSDRNIVTIYLCGSLLGDEYELGGTVDIDLFFIHAGTVEEGREIVRLTDDVHLDIAHHDQRYYRDTRTLRLHPWMGPNINTCEIYYDPGHFMDFTQASVRGQFDQPEYVLNRARTQANSARQIWFAYENEQPEAGPSEIGDLLRAVGNAGNAISSLIGPPLTERRYLLQFQQRTDSLRRQDLFTGFMALLGAQNVEIDSIRSWLEPWEAAYDLLRPGKTLSRLDPVRKQYYLRAFESILDSQQPGAILWPLLSTWTLIPNNLPKNTPARESWQEAFRELGFLEDGFSKRIMGLDNYLDQVEESLDDWARAQGIG